MFRWASTSTTIRANAVSSVNWTGQLALDIAVFTRMGIYELQGDDLRIFFGGDHERAKNFDGKPKTTAICHVQP
jgi:hypothetical protein